MTEYKRFEAWTGGHLEDDEIYLLSTGPEFERAVTESAGDNKKLAEMLLSRGLARCVKVFKEVEK